MPCDGNDRHCPSAANGGVTVGYVRVIIINSTVFGFTYMSLAQSVLSLCGWVLRTYKLRSPLLPSPSSLSLAPTGLLQSSTNKYSLTVCTLPCTDTHTHTHTHTHTRARARARVEIWVKQCKILNTEFDGISAAGKSCFDSMSQNNWPLHRRVTERQITGYRNTFHHCECFSHTYNRHLNTSLPLCLTFFLPKCW